MEFRFAPSEIPDVILVTHQIFKDQRGFFLESFREEPFLNQGIPHFVQDNHARSSGKVLRGLHYQLQPAAIGKLIRCLRGRIFDVAVDIRKGSPTFGQHVAVRLSGENKRQLLIPRGFAHGFVVLSETCTFAYKVDNYYSPECDRGIAYNDPALNIDWIVSETALQLSAKDTAQPLFSEADLFDYGTDLYA